MSIWSISVQPWSSPLTHPCPYATLARSGPEMCGTPSVVRLIVVVRRGGTNVVVEVVVVVVVVDEVDVVVVSAEVGSGIESGPSPGVHPPTSIIATVATLLQRTYPILPGRISFHGAKLPVFNDSKGILAAGLGSPEE